MATFTEQQVRERLIRSFIDKDPIPVALKRPQWTVTAAGGRTISSYNVLPYQLFYFQPFKRRITVEFARGPQNYGEEETVLIHYLMIGASDVDWALKDEFIVEPDPITGESRLDLGMYRIRWINASHWDHRQAGVEWRGLQDGP